MNLPYYTIWLLPICTNTSRLAIKMSVLTQVRRLSQTSIAKEVS